MQDSITVNGKPYELPSPDEVAASILHWLEVGSVVCRGRLVQSCYHGRAGVEVGYDGGDWREDGTFDGESIVCDACYVHLGCPLNPVLPR